MPSFRLGDQGSAVAEIRAILVTAQLLPDTSGPDALAVDDGEWASPEAVFDEALDHAVRAFQQQRGLLADGIVGAATYRALLESSYNLGSRILLFRLSSPMTGDDVAALQSRLQNLGYYPSLVDGVFGEATHTALCRYQSEYDLASDGICGPATLRSLDRLGNRITGGSPHTIREEERLRRSGPQLSGKRVLIDAGTGGTHPLSTGEIAGLEDYVLHDLAQRLEGRMGAAGMDTFVSHAGHTDPDALVRRSTAPDDSERAHTANAVDADLVIALRCAHHPTSSARGVASFYFGNSPASFSAVGRNLASFIQREIVARTGLYDCRTHPRTWPILRETRMPTALIEIGYITNPEDAQWLQDPAHRDTVAEAILVAVKRVYLLGENDRPTGTYTFADLIAAERAIS
ncbi:peptidoglycan-binding protein [Gordonia sp. X0973]|uniref:N-acetylmuramoyl-L-alanine amidase n=1 Tax=Gordonia sp. X0973 TaxID=2742602 RepID=UPI000F5341C6|nr:N-acetylmuramoyl-L-alanine amidase [Gordonia sp. X0973]QKT08933.1 peptidoglycan-binding protein [Gordonia sp. X0973]